MEKGEVKDLSIIIVNYNTFQLTSKCLKSIYENVFTIDFEVILVDCGSQDCEPSRFLEEFPQIVLLDLKQNVGFGGANNKGFKVAQGNFILLLNSDTVVFDDAIQRTYNYLTNQVDVGVVGCKLLNENGSEQTSSYIFVRFPLLNLFINGNPILHKVSQRLSIMKSFDHRARTLESQRNTHLCESVSGAFMMLKKEVIERCGTFDPDFFMYSEETEWCRNRVSKHFKIAYYADAAIIHFGGGSSKSRLYYKQSLLSSFLYNYKKGGMRYAAVILVYLTNSLFIIGTLIFLKKKSRLAEWGVVRAFFEIIPYLLFDIPRYGRAFGSRKNPLLIKELRKTL
ncbi:MAG TPA: glycosyltransferase family 2 protein [Cyclobacteriaceae bacterium]|nr:glycosyltransferase family 2 protein [Cyclobacteriaceae bacterium]